MQTKNNAYFLDIKLKDYEMEFLRKIGLKLQDIYIRPHKKLFQIFTKDVELLSKLDKKGKKGMIIWDFKELKTVKISLQQNVLAYGILENYLLRFQNPIVLCAEEITKGEIRRRKINLNTGKGWEKYKAYLRELYLNLKEKGYDIIFLKDVVLPSNNNNLYSKIYLLETLWELVLENQAHIFMVITAFPENLPIFFKENALKLRKFKLKKGI